jgi:hypothetical protein
MKEVTLPDGKVIKIPDNLDPAKRSELASAVSRQYDGFNIDEPTLGGRVAEFGKAIPREGLSGLANIIKGPVALFDIGNDSAAYKYLEEQDRALREDSFLAPEAGYEDLYSTKIGGAFGSVIPYLGAGLLGGAIGKAANLSQTTTRYGLPIALAGSPGGIGQGADLMAISRELGEEISPIQEITAEILNATIGASEVFPIANILKKVPKKALKDLPTRELILEYMKSAAQAATYEGAQEVGASLARNLVARGLYSDELPIVDSVFEEFTLGGIVGGTLDLVFNSMQKRRGIATHEEGERAERAKVDSNKLINAKKAELAEQQGVLPVIQDQPFKLAPSIPTPVELEVAPDLQIIENTDSTFSLLDQNNLENPVIKTVPTQAEALVENKKIKDTFAQKQIQQQLDNDLYSLGLINSSTAYRIGESLLNPNSVSVGINTIIKYDPKAKNKTLKKYREELETAGTYNKLPFQNQYTIADAQKLLSKSEFNNFASDAAAKIFETSEKNGTPSIRDGKQTIDTSRKYIKDFAAGKNIDLDFNTPAVNYAAKLYTGEGNYSKMSKGQKELFLAKIHSLPNFNVKTPFPNFAPRAYSAKDTADFVATIGSTEFVGRDVQNFLKDREISTLAASDFLSDLDKSGRAQFVKGKEKGFLTSVRQIKPNFEFDIARRAEGFNETPEEFRTRLESQGELKAEVIEQMVQNETARQEPYTPPKQLEEQTINFAEAMEEGRTNKFAKELRKILNVRGLKDTGVIVSNDILSTRTLKEQDGQIAFDPREVRQAEGEYDKNTDIIFLSLNAVNPDGNATDAEIQTRLNKILDHEMIHALRAKDLITENEYRYLKNLVKNRRVPKLVDAQAFEQKETFYTRSKRINAGIENYGASANKVEEIYIEEAIAELFRTREVVAQDVPPKAKGIYNKIVQFFQGVGNAMKISGYNKAADIFQDIEAGKVGTRTRGEIRTLRDLDQAGRGQARVVTDYEDDRETPTGPVIETNLKPSTIRPLAFDPRATPTTTPTTPTTPVTPTTPTTPVTPVTPIATPTVTPSVPTTIFDARKISNKEYIQQRKNILLGLQEAGVIDKRIFDANGKVIDTKKGNNDSVKMLKWLIDNSPSEDYKIIAQKTYQSLLSLKKIGYKFPFKIVNEESSFRGRITPLQADGKTRASDQKRTAVLSMTIADPSANYLFNKDRWRSSNGVNFETLLHENIHQATVAQMFATRDGNATGDAQSFARIEKAFEELQSQQKRLKKHYDDRIKYYKNASKQLNNPKVQEEISKKLFDLVVNNPIEAEIAQIFIKENSDAPYTYIQQDTYLSEINLKAFRDFEIGYQLFGKRKQTNRDVSEMLTFGLTNRSFQKMLESIPYKNNKTLWQGFVESVRKILGIPAKLDTELSAFLSNAAEVLDAQAIGLEPINPRAPPKTKETDQSSYGTMPTKAVITSPFKQDTSIPEKPWRGKINGFEVELQRNPDASGGESVWSAYLPPRTQEVNGVMLSGDGGLDLRNNRKESTEFLLDQWQSMLNRGYTINPYNGFAQWQMKKVITLEDSRQDVPTFSRISKRGELDNRIADLDRRIEIKENTLRQDSQYLGTASYNRMSNEIDVLKGQRARLVEERNNLPPEQIPLFSRVSDIENKYINEDIKLDIFETKNEIKLSKIIVSERNMGVGTSVMNDLTNYADINNKVITLTPSKDFGATSVNRLKTFYKRFGFVENKGRNKDFSYRDSMYRLPQTSQDIPLFSRAATDTSPAYADFFEIFEDYSRGMETNDHFNVLLDTSEISWQERSEYRDGNTSNYFARYIKAKEESAESGQLVSFDGRDDIVLELETREKYNLETFPRVFVMRMPINDFIKLTTPDDLFIEEQITPYIKDNKFDPLEFGYSGDTPFSFPVLAIDSKGQVTGHDGRGRSLTALQDGATEVPVILFIERGKDDNLQENYKFMGDQIDDFTPMTLGIGALFPQKYQGINNRPETFGKTQFRKDYFFDLSRFKDYDIAPLNPLYSITGRDTQNRRKNQMEANKQTVNMINPPIDSSQDVPLFSKASRSFSDGNSNESINRREAVKVAEERTKETPRGEIPFYNLNASDIALEAAIEFNQDPLKTAPNDIPTFSKAMPSNLQEAANTVGVATPKQSLGTRMIDFASNPIASIKKQFKDFRTNYIDNFDAVDKRIIKGSEENDEVRRANNTADTAVMAAIRLADRARGIFQQMLLKGFPVDQIEGMPSLTKVVDLEISTRYNPLIEGDTSTGGLMQILSALQSDPEVDLEGVFSLYAKLKRVKKLNDKGIEIASPIGSKELQAIETIEREHPVVVETYNNYQKWNNGLVKFATKKGLLDADQAAKWIEHSSYYPFYRTMVDDGNMTAPTIAGGSLPNNPLNMPMKGSEEKIDVDPIEAIARNSLSILTAAMKNDGTMKLIRDLEKLNNPEKNIKEATLITDKNKLAGINSVFVFENGNKKHYKIADIDIFMAMQSIGGVKSDGLMKILAIPAGLLRDTVTRDPGFVFVNVFRDTISAAVTSGAPLGGEGFTPIIDSFKNLFGDISSLEEFGVIGGYDFANDEGDIKDFLNRARRRAGLSPNNGLRADVAFYKLWDGLGHLTTKSDGATRKAVADAVYKKLIKEGYTEAQAQSEAAYQGLEIINFGRRGQSSMFKILTTAIPFLNARVQGLDVLYRSFSGQYSAQDKLQEGGSLEDLQGMIMRRALMRLAVMIGTTAMYYALVSDTDEYKAEKLEKRDDNYIIPIGGGNVIYLPIAFEVGMLTKAIPERLFDLISGKDAFSDTSITDFKESTVRQLSNSLNLPFLGGDIGIQAFKPIFEAVTNRASFTNSEIVPYFMAKEKPAYQSRKSTNEIFRLMGETLNISPIKLEYIFKGYTGTLGGYALTVTDALARSVTGTPLMPMNIKQIPLVGRFVGDQEKMGGYQQQFYKLREEVNTAVTTMNSLREDGRMDELYAYRNQVQGLLNAKGQVRALERYMSNWRKRRDRIINRTDINASVRSEMLLDLEIDRDKRLAMIPELRQKANIPPDTVGVLLR